MTKGPGLSGKDADQENFPVASLLISRALRPHVMAFYDFARAADDIADSPDLAASDKVARLDAMERVLLGAADTCGPETTVAARLRDSLRDCELAPTHPVTLLRAFRQDTMKTRYDTWDDLLAYCAWSADPVGRFLLDLHGEDPSGWFASDALCSALQILNHIQDCGADRRDLDRVYVPGTMLAAEGLDVSALDATRTPPALRRVFDGMLDGCDDLLKRSESLPERLRSRRLAAESALIIRLATDLSARLRSGDPLNTRVTPRPIDKLRAGLSSLRTLLVPTRRPTDRKRRA